MATCTSIPPLHEVTFRGVMSHVFDKLGCAVAGNSLYNTALCHISRKLVELYRSKIMNVRCSHPNAMRIIKVCMAAP